MSGDARSRPSRSLKVILRPFRNAHRSRPAPDRRQETEPRRRQAEQRTRIPHPTVRRKTPALFPKRIEAPIGQRDGRSFVRHKIRVRWLPIPRPSCIRRTSRPAGDGLRTKTITLFLSNIYNFPPPCRITATPQCQRIRLLVYPASGASRCWCGTAAGAAWRTGATFSAGRVEQFCADSPSCDSNRTAWTMPPTRIMPLRRTPGCPTSAFPALVRVNEPIRPEGDNQWSRQT